MIKAQSEKWLGGIILVVVIGFFAQNHFSPGGGLLGVINQMEVLMLKAEVDRSALPTPLRYIGPKLDEGWRFRRATGQREFVRDGVLTAEVMARFQKEDRSTVICVQFVLKDNVWQPVSMRDGDCLSTSADEPTQ